jgi:uncharacterized protein
MLRFFLLAILASWLALASLARGAETPIPPPPARWVTDEVGFMSPAARTALDQKLEQYERETGHQVVVWIGDTIGDAALEDWAVRTFQAWGVGRKGLDDGLVMFVLAKDRKIDIEVGYGLEDRVPDAIASRVIREVMTPRLQAGDPDAAITAGADAILAAVEGKPFTPGEKAAPAPERRGGREPIVLVLLGIVFLVIFLTNPSFALSLLWIIASGGRGGGGFGGGGNGFSGGGGRSGGGGARGSW